MADDKMNREHWLAAGFKQLATHGPQGLRIMAIAKEMGVTKGSFYWHFKDLREYRAALLADWESLTHEGIQQLELQGGNFAAKMHRLLSLSEARSNRRLTLALRSWALSDPVVAKAVSRVDEVRIEYVADMLREHGWSKKDANTMSQFAYQGLVGRLILTDVPLTMAQHEFILKMFTPK